MAAASEAQAAACRARLQRQQHTVHSALAAAQPPVLQPGGPGVLLRYPLALALQPLRQLYVRSQLQGWLRDLQVLLPPLVGLWVRPPTPPPPPLHDLPTHVKSHTAKQSDTRMGARQMTHHYGMRSRAGCGGGGRGAAEPVPSSHCLLLLQQPPYQLGSHMRLPIACRRLLRHGYG